MAAGKTKMKINSKHFRVREGDEVNLVKWPTKVEPVYKSKEQYKSVLEEHIAKLSAMQELHYLQSARRARDSTGDRRRRKGRRDPACDVGRQSAGLSGL
jgi:hypothetical protein